MTKKSESLVWKQLIMVLKSKSFYLESVNYGQKVRKSGFESINYDKESKSLIQKTEKINFKTPNYDQEI